MEIIDTDIPEVKILKPRIFEDARGYFFESFSEREFCENVADVHFVQDNQSKSSYGVIRGLHFQAPPHAQAKLVRCVEGKVLDVAVDIRVGSPTYGQYVAVELSAENQLQLFIPHGFAHGFSVLSETAVFQYKCDNYYCPESEGGLNLFDPRIGIDWRVPSDKSIISDKDSHRENLSNFKTPFCYDKFQA